MLHDNSLSSVPSHDHVLQMDGYRVLIEIGFKSYRTMTYLAKLSASDDIVSSDLNDYLLSEN